jgi:putative endonuclease
MAYSPRVECSEFIEEPTMPYFVYILRGFSNKLYVGQTNNLHNRTKQHTTKDWKAAKFTKDNDGFVLAYCEEFETLIDAIQREKQIKGWSRAKKEALIARDIVRLKTLSKRTPESHSLV